MSIPGFSGGSAVKSLFANAGDVRDLGLIPESGRSLEEEMATLSSILAGKSLGQRRLEGYSPWGHKRVGYDLAANTELFSHWPGSGTPPTPPGWL